MCKTSIQFYFSGGEDMNCKPRAFLAIGALGGKDVPHPHNDRNEGDRAH
jgi:hypothetical protein